MTEIQKLDGVLTGLLDRTDDDKLRRVVKVIEATGQRQVLEPSLAPMRARLRQLRPQRPLTLARLLTAPFELALVDDDSPHAPFAVCRGRLRHWQEVMLERLDGAVLEAAKQAAAGRTADDRFAVLEAGGTLWPAAGKALAGLAQPDAAPGVAAERLRVADLLELGPVLLPLLDRLLPIPPRLDAEAQTELAGIIDLGAAGPPDRLVTLASALLRAAPRPWMLASALLERAPGTLRDRLRGVLEQLLPALRSSLERLVDRHAEPAAGSPPPSCSDLAADLERLADALVPPAGEAIDAPFAPGDTGDVRRRAATLATARFAAVIEGVLLPLPAADLPERAAAQRSREAAARGLARLARTALRLDPEAGVRRLTEAAIERLVNDGAACQEGRRQPVGVEDARLIEILAGPDVAWRHFRPEARSGYDTGERRCSGSEAPH